jgi:hypothetical protein
MARAGLYQLGAGGFRSTGIGNKRSVGKSLGGSSYDETRGGQGALCWDSWWSATMSARVGVSLLSFVVVVASGKCR